MPEVNGELVITISHQVRNAIYAVPTCQTILVRMCEVQVRINEAECILKNMAASLLYLLPYLWTQPDLCHTSFPRYVQSYRQRIKCSVDQQSRLVEVIVTIRPLWRCWLHELRPVSGLSWLP